VATLAPTPSQTVGPFFGFALPYDGGNRLVDSADPDAIEIVGTVCDGAGAPVPDGLVEFWQANRAGRYAHPEDDRQELPLEPGFRGFGRCPTDSEGRFEFVTVKPGPVPGPAGVTQAPHVDVSVFARGLLKRLVTRIYFPDEPQANAADPVLASIEDPALRATLVATDEGSGRLRFDVHLQSDRQTVFFAV
jgi:protocatechuate 3,4-dioxygenase, alpha subunit